MNKMIVKLLAGVLFVLAFSAAHAQSTANYLPTPTTVTTGTNGSLALDMNSNAIDMSTGTTTLVSAGLDDTQSGLTNFNLGSGSVFDFYFMGVRYTQFAASDNGVIGLGATPGTATYTIPNTTIPTIAAFANDMRTGSDGKVEAKVVGTAPNRTLVVQWTNNMIRFTTAAPGTGTWQVRLYETTGVIEFVYGTMTTNAATPAVYYVGFSSNTTANNLVTLNTNTNAANTGATATSNSYTASSTITDLNSAANGSRKYYRFTPPVPAAPTAPLTFTSVTATGMTVNWTAASPTTNVLKYAVYYSTDGGTTYTFANTTNVGTNTLAVTGLLPSTTYSWKVVSVSEGGISTATTGSQATAAPAVYYWVGTSGSTWNTAANWNTNPAGGGTTRTTVSTTDILIVDGAGTTAGAATTISVDLASFSIGQFKVTSNTACTLQSSNTTTRTITITGATGDDYVIEAGSSLILNNAANAVAFAFSGTGNTGDISGTLTLGGSTSNVVTTTGGTSTLVTVSSTGIVNLTAASSTAVLVGSTATLTFANGSNCNVSGYTTSNAFIPTATWGASSNVTLTGGTSGTGITTSSTSFGNFTYNSATQTATFSAFTSGTITIQGNLTITATNTGTFRAVTTGTLSIGGNLVMTAGTFQASSSTGTINVTGNITINGGSFDIAQGGASTLRVGGNFIQNAGTILQTSTTGTLEFNGTASQTLTLVGGAHGTNAINARINNTAGVNLTSAFSIRNLTVSKGNLSGAGSLTYNGTSSTLTYNSTTGVQTATAVEFPSTGGPSSLTINNTFTAPNNTVSVPFTRALAGTAGALTLTAGILDNTGFTLSVTNTATAGISGGSATTYVKGAIERNLPASLLTGSTYTWPIGKGTYNPFFLVNPTTSAGGTVTVKAEVVDANAGGTPGINMGSLNTDRYWAASITAGSGNFTNSFIRLNDASVVGSSAIAASTTQTGAYDIVGNTSPTIVAGTSVTSAGTASTTIPGFYVIGLKAVAMTYVSSTTTQAVVTPIIKPATNQQMIGLQVVTTGNASPLTMNSIDFNTNGSSAALTDISNARVWYTGTSSTFATTTQFGTDYASPSGSFTVNGTQMLSEGTNYFWLVYDVPAGAIVNNVLDAECSGFNAGTTQNPTPTAPAGTRTIKAALNGNYLIGASQTAPNYAKLTDAITDLNAYGVSGPVIFSLQSDYSSATESFPLTINAIAGGGAVNTVTIKPASGVTATISGSVVSGALIKLNGADYVTIDGSNSGGTDRSLAITNTATTAPSGVSLVSLGTGAGATNNTIKNCNISTGVQTTTGYGIAVGGSTPGTTGADNDNVTIQNNNISACVVGIYAQGTATTSTGGDDNLNITGNTVTYNSNLGVNVGINVNNSLTTTINLNTVSIITTATSGLAYGMQLGGTTGATVNQNTISVSTAATTAPVGISLETNFVSSVVNKNLITGVTTSATNGYGGRGITIGTGTATSALTLSNNMIYGVNGSNFSSFGNSSALGIGIGIIGNSSTLTTTTGGVNLYYNSINMYGNHSYSSATITTGLYVGSGATALDIRNNIFVNSLNNTTTTGSKNYCIYSAAANTAFSNINYNDYYPVSSANSTGFVGFLGADQSAITDWRTASAQDAQSFAGDPKFLSNTNLHINTAVVTPVESSGVTIGAVSDDYDGDTRGGTPDVGADEGTFIAPSSDDISATAFINPTNGGSKSLNVSFTPQASFTNSGTATQTNVTVRYRIVDATLVEVYNQTSTIASIGSSVTTTVTFPAATLNATGTYTIYAKAELAGDAIPANDEITGTMTVTDPYTSSTTTQNTANVGINTTSQQVIGISVVVSGTSATVSSIDFNTNGTTAPATDITNAKIFYTGNTSTFSATGQFGSTVASPNGSHTVSGTQALLNGTNYFWLTYDIPSGATVANVVDAECTSITVNGVARTPTVTAPAGGRTIVGPMAGTYLVGASQTTPNYVNLSAAIADLSFRGVSAAVVFELQNDYSSAGETFPLSISAFTGASSSNTLTIKPGTGVTATISGNNALSILTLNGADYVIVDGSNAGTTSRNLTISNTNTSTSGSIVSIVSASAANGATNNTIKNCILTGNANNTTLAGVFGGASDGFSNALIANSNNSIQNNQISLASEGILIGGFSGAPMDDNWVITQNIISNIGFDGLWLNNMQNYTVSNNNISSVSLNANPSVTGILLEAAHAGGTISRNLISGIKNTTTRGAYGIQLAATTTSSNITVSNNFIYDVTGNGQATLARNGFGIYASAGGGYKIYFNTVHLNTNQSTTTGTTAAMLISGVTTAASLDIRNNIFANTQTTGAAAATRYSIYSANANTVFSAIDNNDYYTSGTSLGFLGSNLATLANIQTGFGSNTSSISLLPVFTSLTDLHLTSASANYPLKAGTSIAGITADYDAQTRNVTVPALGADEIYVPGFWTGAASTIWDASVTGNWDDNAVPTSGANIVIPAGVSNSPVLTGVSPTIGTLNIGSGKTLGLNGQTLTVNGAVSGSGTISGSSSSNLVIGGSAGTLNFTSGSESLNNLTLNNTSSATLGTALDVYGTIALNTATLNLNAKHLTLKSNATNTARIADLTGSTLSGATNVTMERYIKLRAGGSGRAYRLLAPTVNTSGSIKANWMEGGMNTAIGTNDNPVPTYGTQITGSGGNANGFDKTVTNAASLYATANAVTPTYTAINSTSGTMNALTGYFVYLRGDRSQDMTIPLAPNMPTSATTLRTTGSLVTGTQTSFTNAYTGGGALNLVTNPYPSPIDWSLVKAASSNITDYYTLWDPNFGTRGGFVTVSSAGVASSGLATQYIQSGQAFFVESDGVGTPSVSIQEGHKVAGNNNDVFLTPPPPVEAFRTELYLTEPNGYRRVVDGAIALYNNSYSATVDKKDAKEVNNWDENIAYSREGKHLAIECRPVIEKSDDLPIFMNNMKKQAYEFEFTPAVFTNTNLKAELVDNFLGTRTLLSVVTPTVVSFTITDNPASASSDRFKVVFGQFGNPQGVDAITIKALQQGSGVQVDWSSKTETDMLKYEVERSVYGTSFTKINSTMALGNSSNPVNYNWLDASPNMGTNFYRIKGTDKAGNIRYSEAVRVLFGKGEPSIVVYPNPLQGTTFKIDLYNLVKGTYQLNLYNNTGQLVHSEQVQHDGSQATKTISLKSDIGKGVYQLQLAGNGFKTTQRIIKN